MVKNQKLSYKIDFNILIFFLFSRSLKILSKKLTLGITIDHDLQLKNTENIEGESKTSTL